jgi:ribosomal protein L15
MTDTSAFTKLVPGFDFLQSLAKNAGNALPSMGQWVAPTLNPEELNKRIEELKTVQFWLEQNARMLSATIQALEVQRMTLSTLKTMNVQMTDLRESLTAKAKDAVAGPGTTTNQRKLGAKRASKAPSAVPPALPGAAVDPMQWWGALTKQFTQLATTAMKETATDAAKSMGQAMVKQGIAVASDTLKSAAAAPMKAAATMAAAAHTANQRSKTTPPVKRAAKPTKKTR